MILVQVKSISVTDMGFVVFLKNKDDMRLFPIFVGSTESKAISTVLMGERSKRPMTHDLMKRLLQIFKVKIQMVVIDSLSAGTLKAKIYLQSKSLIKQRTPYKGIAVDARPSDAIALALRSKAGIFVSETIFNRCAISLRNISPIGSGVAVSEDHNEAPPNPNLDEVLLHEQSTPKEKGNEEGQSLNKLDTNQRIEICKKKLQTAISEERFEEAASIRDDIQKLISSFNEH